MSEVCFCVEFVEEVQEVTIGGSRIVWLGGPGGASSVLIAQTTLLI